MARVARGQEIRVAAAADLQFAMQDLAAQFEKRTTMKVNVTYGSSGNFFSQLQNGAPFDLFLSADARYPQNLARDGAAAGNVFDYAAGRLVVWVPAGSKADPATALRDPSVRHVAIANPEHAPYGVAAEAALRAMGLYDTVQPKLVLSENISQAFQFVESGAADCGIVALSLASAPTAQGRGRYWEVPAEMYPKIEQAGVILKDSPAARQFRDWLTGPAGQELLRRYGFSLPGE
jgi:molybdate transport system substrate-binding protein